MSSSSSEKLPDTFIGRNYIIYIVFKNSDFNILNYDYKVLKILPWLKKDALIGILMHFEEHNSIGNESWQVVCGGGGGGGGPNDTDWY